MRSINVIKTSAFIVGLFWFNLTGFTQCQWLKLSAGKKHNLAIKNDGTLWAWGINDFGQLGDNSLTNRNEPTQVGTDTDWSVISAGENHSMAIKQNGTLWTWGDNGNGQLGDGGIVFNRVVPGQVGVETFWSKISAGYKHCLAIQEFGTSKYLWVWGDNTYGQLGLGVQTSQIAAPTQLGAGSSWANISAGGHHSLMSEFGAGGQILWAAGENINGQLGTMNNVSSNVLVAVVSASNNWTAIDAGGFFSVARKSDGTLWSWGHGLYGELGNGVVSSINTATQINAATNWGAFSAGNSHVIAKKSDGTVWSWGNNNDGQLGNGTTTSISSPQQIGLDVNWSGFLVAGFAHSGGIRIDGTMNTWGFGGNGELGNGYNLTVQNPTLIDCPPSSYLEIEETSGDNIIVVYPNPSNSGDFYFQTHSKISEIAVYNLYGQHVNFEWNGLQSIHVNASLGTYFVVLKDQNERIFQEKLILN